MPSKAKQREAEIAFHYAIRNGRVDEVKRRLKDGVDPNAFDDKSNNFRYAFTALCTAINAAAHTISRERAQLVEAFTELFPIPHAPICRQSGRQVWRYSGSCLQQVLTQTGRRCRGLRLVWRYAQGILRWLSYSWMPARIRLERDGRHSVNCGVQRVDWHSTGTRYTKPPKRALPTSSACFAAEARILQQKIMRARRLWRLHASVVTRRLLMFSRSIRERPCSQVPEKLSPAPTPIPIPASCLSRKRTCPSPTPFVAASRQTCSAADNCAACRTLGAGRA